MDLDALSNRAIGLAIEVRKTIGPGLLEAVYRECLCLELAEAGIPYRSEVPIPVVYKGRVVPLGFRVDIPVDERMILEIETVSAITSVHRAQLLTYLRTSGVRVGLIVNFSAPRLKDGPMRCIV